MDWKKYTYLSQSDFLNDEVIANPRPLLKVTLTAPASKIEVMGLVDSGTDSTLVHSSIAEALFISRNTCRPAYVKGTGKKLGGVPGDVVGFHYSSLKVKYEGFEEIFELPVTFVDDLPVEMLLGQKDFFNCFDVKFSKNKGVFELARV